MTRMCNQIDWFVSARLLRGMDGEFLDHRVSEQFAGQLLDGRQGRAIGRPVDLKLKALSLTYSGHVAEAEAMRSAEYRLPLGVMNLRLEHDVDDHSGHEAVLSWGNAPRT